jgi:hypothetical protein
MAVAFAAGLFTCGLVGFRRLFFRGTFFRKRPAAATASIGVGMGKLFSGYFFQLIHGNLLQQNIL